MQLEADAADGRLDEEQIDARFHGGGGGGLRRMRRGGHGGDSAAVLDLANSARDQVGADGRVGVETLDESDHALGRRIGDGSQDSLGVVVARLNAVEVENRQTARLAHLERERGVDRAIERGGQNRNLKTMPAQLPGDIDIAGVDDERSRHQRDLIEPIGATRPLVSPDNDFQGRPPVSAT